MPANRSGLGDASARRAIEIVDVFDARIAPGFRQGPISRRKEGRLGRLVLDDRLDHDIAIREAGVRRRGRESPQSLHELFGLQLSLLDAAFQRLCDRGDPLFERRLGDVDEHGIDAAQQMRSRDAGAHDAGPDHADALDRLRRDPRIGDAGVLRESLVEEEESDEIPRDRTADEGDEMLRLDREGGVERQIAALLDRGDGRHRCRQMALRLRENLCACRLKSERRLFRGQADRQLLLAAKLDVGSGVVGEEATAFREETIARHRVENDAELAGSTCRDGFARRDQFGRQAGADETGEPLRAAPAGDDADLRFGKTDLDLRMAAGQAIVEAERQLQAAADAGAVDEHDRRARQFRKPGDDFVTAADEPTGLCGGRGGEFLDVGAGDEHAWLAAPEDDAMQVRRRLQLREDLGELRENGGAERVRLAAGQVERDDGDAVGIEIEAKGGEIHGVRLPRIGEPRPLRARFSLRNKRCGLLVDENRVLTDLGSPPFTKGCRGGVVRPERERHPTPAPA